MKNYYDGMQEYVDGLSNVISQGLTLADSAKNMFFEVINVIKSHLKDCGLTDSQIKQHIASEIFVSEVDFEDVKSDFCEFWKNVEDDVISGEIKVVLRKPESVESSSKYQRNITIASLNDKVSKFSSSYINKVGEFYAKLAELSDFAEEKGVPQVGGTCLDIADIVTENLTVSVITLEDCVDSIVESLSLLNNCEENKDKE